MTVMRPHSYSGRRSTATLSGGFSLIELLVGILVSMICVLAIMSAFAVYEGRKRTTTSVNDAEQNGSFSLFELEREVRSAGAGIVNGSNYSLWGCPINATTNGTVVLPNAAASLPAPFNSLWTSTQRAMPVLAASGGASQSDAIAVLSGNAAYQAFNISVVNVPSSNSITVANNFDIQQNDYLIAPLSNGSCALTQVSTLSGTTGLILSTTNSSTANLPTAQYIFDLGAQPTYTLYGVNATNNTLVSYDLLQRTTNGGNTTTPIASGIVAMKVLYGIHDGSTSGMPDNYIDKWVQPTGTWDISALSASTSAAANAINEIKAVRIAVVAQSRLPESASSYTTGAATLTLFPDLTSSGLQYAVTTLPQYRYRVYDTTIPVQNAMINNHY